MECSRLFRLEPVGLGTGDCEALTSFTARLAAAHSVSVTDLIVHGLKDGVPKWLHSGARHIARRAGALNSVGALALGFSNALGEATHRDDLRFLTMLTYRLMLPSNSVIRTERAWCPYCYQEQVALAGTRWDLLVWALKPVTCCPKHSTRLQETCPSCHRGIPHLSPRYRPGVCSFCNEVLIGPAPDQAQNPVEIAVAEAAGEMVRLAPLLSREPEAEDVLCVLDETTDHFSSIGGLSLRKALGIPKSLAYCWRHRSSSPGLGALLFLCVTLGLSVSQLVGSEALVRRDGVPGRWCTREQRTARSLKADPRVGDLLRDLARESSEVIMSMQEVGRQLGFNKRALYAAYPNESRCIGSRYSEEVKSVANRRVADVCEQVRQVVKGLRAKGIDPSRRRVEQFIPPAAFCRPLVEATWREAVDSMTVKEDRR